MKRRYLFPIVCSLLLLLGLYVAMFSFAWLGSPSRFETFTNQRAHVVEFHFSRLFWSNTPIWDPAFWIMDRVFGYHLGPYSPMEEDSIGEYVKPL